MHDTYPIDNVRVEMVNLHDPHLCMGRGCSVHHPSNHHMKDWPMVWRPSKGMFERQCPHGIGHPDPDDVVYHASIGDKTAGIHGCDGCCSTERQNGGPDGHA
jgi:hypothetical protein